MLIISLDADSYNICSYQLQMGYSRKNVFSPQSGFRGKNNEITNRIPIFFHTKHQHQYGGWCNLSGIAQYKHKIIDTKTQNLDILSPIEEKGLHW